MKKISQYIPLHLCAFLVFGVLLGYYYSFPIPLLIIALAIALLSLVTLYSITKQHFSFNGLFQIFSYLTILIAGIASISFQDVTRHKSHYSHYKSDGNSLIIQIEKRLKPTIYQHKYYAQVLQIDSRRTSGKIVLNVTKDSLNTTLSVGKIYYSKTALQQINTPLNPYGFNYSEYLKKQGVHHQTSVKSNEVSVLPMQNNTLRSLAAQWRNHIQTSLEKHPFKADELAIINAIILGQRQSISKDLLNSYAGAGAIHILAVSGLHVGILFLLLNFLLKPIKKFPRGDGLKTLLIISILWAFALLTGLSGSVVRAVTMFSFIAVGLSIKNQRSPVLHSLITSFFFLVLLYPLYLFDVGFQMSYAAVLGIVLLQPKIENLIPRIHWFFPRRIWQLLTVSLAATIGTLPISLYYFHQFPGLFFLSNVVIIPFIGLIMAIGLIVVTLSVVNLLPDILVRVYGGMLHLMNRFIEWVAHQEQFLFKDISFSIFALLASYFVIIMGYRWWVKTKAPRFLTFLTAIIVFQIVFLLEKYQTNNTDELIIFHKSRESVLGVKEANKLYTWHSFDSIASTKLRFLTNYKIANRMEHPIFTKQLPNIIEYGSNKILVIDSLGIYQNISFKPNIILLQQSPRINIERLLQEQQPNTIIADGSNYKSYVSSWRETCLKNKVDFHYTGKDGAFMLKK